MDDIQPTENVSRLRQCTLAMLEKLDRLYINNGDMYDANSEKQLAIYSGQDALRRLELSRPESPPTHETVDKWQSDMHPATSGASFRDFLF
jgi:hypothetical protein